MLALFYEIFIVFAVLAGISAVVLIFVFLVANAVIFIKKNV